jgi:hypothetical protein
VNSTSGDWAREFARQARADYQSWQLLADHAAVPECHRLLFLQMTCEKLSKAYLCARGSNPSDIQRSHGYTAKTLPIVIRQEVALAGNRRRAAWILQQTKLLAQEIEVLSPAEDRAGRRPDNCEYPWDDESGQLHSPLDWTFTPSRLLASPAGRTFIKLLQTSIQRLL